MKCLRYLLPILCSLYLLYLAKSALGINVSDRYSAWKVLKLPIQTLLHKPHPS